MTTKEYVRWLIMGRRRNNPIQIKELIQMLRTHRSLDLSERDIKKIVQQLRDEGYPVLASRRRPYGYYWCSSPEELDDFARVITAQAKSELATIAKMKKKYFPQYAEQGALEFA